MKVFTSKPLRLGLWRLKPLTTKTHDQAFTPVAIQLFKDWLLTESSQPHHLRPYRRKTWRKKKALYNWAQTNEPLTTLHDRVFAAESSLPGLCDQASYNRASQPSLSRLSPHSQVFTANYLTLKSLTLKSLTIKSLKIMSLTIMSLAIMSLTIKSLMIKYHNQVFITESYLPDQAFYNRDQLSLSSSLCKGFWPGMLSPGYNGLAGIRAESLLENAKTCKFGLTPTI